MDKSEVDGSRLLENRVIPRPQHKTSSLRFAIKLTFWTGCAKTPRTCPTMDLVGKSGNWGVMLRTIQYRRSEHAWGRLGVFAMSTEKQVIDSLTAGERTEKLASRLGDDRIGLVLDAIRKSPANATSARRLSRCLGLSRWHVEASMYVLHERRQIRFKQGCALACE